MRIKPNLPLLVLICGSFCSMLLAQPLTVNWKKRIKTADELYAKGNFASAGDYYLSVYKEKNSRTDLAYKAGECYLKVRDYKSASEAFRPIRNLNQDLDRVGFKYAMTLKYQGEYAEAINSFEDFIDDYKKNDREKVYNEVLNEVSGCMLAIELQKNSASDSYLKHLGFNVNTDKTEFGPLIISDDVIYFSSTTDGSAKIYRSEKIGNTWSKRDKPDLLDELEKPHYGNGSFTPEGDRFYFTQCEINEANESICAIYVMQKENRLWKAPVKLPNYINEPGFNHTHPFVLFEDNKEILYFSSNKPGGQGGMDLWYVIKTKEGAVSDFSPPVNLGNTVNTDKDEITPFFDAADKTLYFSSNGHINIGGLDIFRSKGSKTTWSTPSNLGFPFNTSADDLYYTEGKKKGEGLLVSNRIDRPDKMTTSDDDIFSFVPKSPENKIEITVAGRVFDYDDDQSPTVEEVKVNLLQVINDNETRLMKSVNSFDGNYRFTVETGAHFRIQAIKPGYLTAFFDLMTFEVDETTAIKQDIPLERSQEVVSSEAEIPIEAEPEIQTPAEVQKQPEKTVIQEPVAVSPKPQVKEKIPPAKTETPEIPIKKEAAKEAKPLEPIAKKPAPILNEAGEVQLILPINPETGLPEKGKEAEFGKKMPLFALNNVEKTAIIRTIDKDLAYLRKNESWIPVDLSAKAPPKPEPPVQPEPKPVDPEPVTEEKKPAPIAKEQPTKPIVKEETPKPAVGAPEAIPMKVEYRIQMAAVEEFVSRKFSRVAPIGEFLFEDIQTKNGNLLRVMFGGYASSSGARADLKKVREGGFSGAFLIRYENGKRVGQPIY